MSVTSEFAFLDAGVLIGALSRGDPRHPEAFSIVESVRRGGIRACTSSGILSEVYAALTWQGACPCHEPGEAAKAVWSLMAPPSELVIADCGLDATRVMLDMAVAHGLRTRDIHDARHAAVALTAGVSKVLTYDVKHWERFSSDGFEVVGPPSVLSP
jgi:predicted nucleic acid-binding protein